MQPDLQQHAAGPQKGPKLYAQPTQHLTTEDVQKSTFANLLTCASCVAVTCYTLRIECVCDTVTAVRISCTFAPIA